MNRLPTQLKRVCLLTHSVLFLKCNLLQNKLKVEQIVHSWELYIYSLHFLLCKYKLFLYTQFIPKSPQ